MIQGNIVEQLCRIVGAEHLITDRDALREYASDGTKLQFFPDAVASPKNNEQVSQILRLATHTGFPVIPRGAGSGMSGGALPVKGGLVLSMNRFDRILLIDQDNLIAKVEPGVITAHLQEAVEKIGLFYPPDPASLNVSTMGGNLAECAGGLRTVKYGVTRDYVLGLTVVLPTGEILKTGVETMKGVVGYDLTRLLIGSEGTLAVITAITVRLLPKPESKKTMTAFFPDVSSAVTTVSHMIREKITPTILELLDRLCLDCVREEMNLSIPAEVGAMLLIELDGREIFLNHETEKVRRICSLGGAYRFETASTEQEAERLWEARRKASPSLYKLKPHKISEDIVVPRTKMGELVDYLGELGSRYGLPIPAFGHAGDGNIHVNVMLDKNKSQDLQKANTLVKELFEKVLEMGGTISGEHGIGITKAPYLEMEIGRAGLELMARIKKAFDPRGILNPGKIFPGSQNS